MSRLALGTAQFGLRYGINNQGGQVSRSEAKSMLRFAFANEIDINQIDIGLATPDIG